MCLAIPVRIERVDPGDKALASVGGIHRAIDTSLIDDLKIGDYVILHVGFALSKVDEEEAQRTLELMNRCGMMEENVHEIRG